MTDEKGFPAPPDGPAPIFAVAGPTAGLLAGNLADVLAAGGKGGWRVLLADAGGGGAPPGGPDGAGTSGAGGPFRDAGPGLSALPSCEGGAGSDGDGALLERARSEFDAVFAACGDPSRAEGWLLAADRVVVSAATARELAGTLKNVERLTGPGGTLLAPMGRLKVPEVLGDRGVFRLPSAKGATFAGGAVGEEARKALAPLLGELVGGLGDPRAAAPEQPTDGPSGTPTAASAEEEGPSRGNDPRGAAEFSAAGIVEMMRRGAAEPENRAAGPSPQTRGGARGLWDGISSLAGSLRARAGWRPGEAARRAEGRSGASLEELDRRIKLSLRGTTVGGVSRVCVGSPKGGVGKSSIAYALAGSMAYYTNMRVCLVDADPNFGSARLLVPRPIGRSVVDLAEAADGLVGLSDLRGYLAQDERMRLDVVLGPEQAHELARLGDLGGAYGRIDGVLSRFYDVVVYDLGLGFRDPAIRRVLSLSDELLFVTDSEIIPNAMLADAVRYVAELGVDLKKTMLVLNHRLPPADESAAAGRVRTAHMSLLRRVTEVPYDPRMSQLLNTRAFHVEDLCLETRLGVLATAAACLEGLRDAGGATEKVLPNEGPDRGPARGR